MENLYKLLGILSAMCAVVLIPALILRYKKEHLQHRERMLALEKGAQLPAYPVETAPWTPRVYLLRGMIWLFSGIGLAIFLIGLSTTSMRQESLETRLFRAQDLRRSGLPEEEFKKYIDSPREQLPGLPAGFGLIGLIPVGVGLAYILFYLGEKKQNL